MAFFRSHFNLTDADFHRYLAAALSKGGDYADLYFEYVSSTSVSLDESMIKSAVEGISVGCGIRVLSGERTGYAYTDDLAPDKILRAANMAAHIASGPSQTTVASLNERSASHSLYNSAAGSDALERKISLVNRADITARGADSRVHQVQASYSDSLRHILIVTSDGVIANDTQPIARLNVVALARSNRRSERGADGGGGRVQLEYFETERTPEEFAREAVRQAVLQLDAAEAPAGEMAVVLGPGWPGILLHEAVGHGLEADFNRKQVSAFSGMLGQRVASELCTVIDDGTLEHRRGSLNLDDEGAATGRTVLIENGVLKSYLQDKLSSRVLGTAQSGNGRRQSYRHMPMPRMTNTFMLAGNDAPEDILRSVDRGLYCVNFGGGQVDITSGKFVFSASESYLIENGKVTRPVRGATLIGNGPDCLTKVSRVGHDLALDRGVGTCGKQGQNVPVGVGIPTVRIDNLTVGGTGAPRGASFQG